MIIFPDGQTGGSASWTGYTGFELLITGKSALPLPWTIVPNPVQGNVSDNGVQVVEDDDNDGVTNTFDQCPDTPAEEPVDPNTGCSETQMGGG